MLSKPQTVDQQEISSETTSQTRNNDVLMLGQHLRRWLNIKRLKQRWVDTRELLFAVKASQVQVTVYFEVGPTASCPGPLLPTLRLRRRE